MADSFVRSAARLSQINDVESQANAAVSRAQEFGTQAASRLGSDLFSKKPDGTFASEIASRFSFSSGSATISSLTGGLTTNSSSILRAATETKATLDVKKEQAPPGITAKRKSTVPNPLEQFASYNVLWTMAVLTPSQFNNPQLYRKDISQLNNIIFSSAGRFDSQRVSTAYGTPEFYINNFNMRCVVGSNEKTGNSNAIGFTFDVYEPYSMGLLLQAMQRAARLAKFENYLDNAPYVLRMDFQGYDELGNVYSNIQPKFFTMKITKVTFQVNEGGSTYKVEAVPWNHQAFADATNTTYKDCKIGGDAKGPGNVEEILVSGTNSLVNFLNNNEKKLKEKELIGETDIYEIQFPVEANVMYSTAGSPPKIDRATVNPSQADVGEVPGVTVFSQANNSTGAQAAQGEINEIGLASLGFDQTDGGTIGFKRANEIYDTEKGIKQVDNMIFNPKERVFQFAQRQSLTSIINQVILSSDWAAQTITKRTKEGFVKWFKVDVQTELLKYDELVQDYSKKIIFRVVPYYVHETIFAEATQKPFGYAELENSIVKYYDYIYTGQNVDIIKFDIQIDNLFYKGAQPAPPQDAGKSNNPEQQGTASNPQTEVKRQKGSADESAQVENVGRSRKKRSPDYLKRVAGGSGFSDSEQEIAEEFYRAFVSGSSADMMRINIEILGDTYWIVDSGYSNYFASTQSTAQINNDGTMNYESGDVYVYISFRTPADVDETTGLYDFNGKMKDSPFGGIYRVVLVENNFVDGVWRQKLECVRMPGPQGPEEGSKKAAQSTDKPGYKFEGPEPETAQVADNDIPVAPPAPAAAVPNIGSFDRFFNSLGDPNAPPYTGDDPIVRARLGLPPVEENRDIT